MREDRIVTIAFIVIFLLAVVIYICISLPRTEKEAKYVLTIRCGDVVKGYEMEELLTMPKVTGLGGYIKKNNVTLGPFNYTGIPIHHLLQAFPLPEAYSIKVRARDGYERNISMDVAEGRVKVYSENGSFIGMGNLTMILAYEKEGKRLGVDEGPLRIAFVSEEGYLTESKLWVKNVVSIEVVATP